MNIVNYKGTNLRVSDIALGGGVLGDAVFPTRHHSISSIVL